MEREKYMQMAMELAKQAAEEVEVPVGCVILNGANIAAPGAPEKFGLCLFKKLRAFKKVYGCRRKNLGGT